MIANKRLFEMDLKSDDIFDVEIDPAILLSYALEEKLILENISSNIFEEEISKNVDNLESENPLSLESKPHEVSNSKEKCPTKSSSTEDGTCIAESKLETYSSNQQESDINANEELYENLSYLLEELELSDSEHEDNTKLKERNPERKQSRAKQNRHRFNDFSKNKSCDRSQFNPQSLNHLSVSQVEVHEPNTYNKLTFCPNLTSILSVNETIPPRQDYFCKDAGAKAIGSPESESGYESSSAQSRSSSPPLLPLCMSDDLDFIPENPDEQIIWEFLIENTTDGALTNHNLSTQDCHNKVKEDKITEIIKYLQDTPNDLKESCNVAPLSENNHEYVPLVSNSEDLDPIFASNHSSPILQSIEMPKKLSYKLNNEAKKTLRTQLSEDNFFAAKRRIYRKLTHDIINHKDVKVIYVEDGKDKGSENRTNLHYAVLDSKIEDVYCLVEIHKQYMKPLKDINIRDKYGKTALDYAILNEMTLVADYLKENTACQSVSI